MKFLLILLLLVCMPFFNFSSLPVKLFSPASLMAQEPEEEGTEEEEVEEEEEEEDEDYYDDEEEEVEEDDYYDDEEVPDYLRYYKEKYDTTYDASFEVVWNAVKLALEEKGCAYLKPNYRQTDEGLYKGAIHSEFCVFTEGEDSTFRVLKQYSFQMPFIRGGIWINGRLQYKFMIKEKSDGTVYILMKTEMSGKEDYVTHEFHFWKSNGILEHYMLEAIENKIKELNE